MSCEDKVLFVIKTSVQIALAKFCRVNRSSRERSLEEDCARGSSTVKS